MNICILIICWNKHDLSFLDSLTYLTKIHLFCLLLFLAWLLEFFLFILLEYIWFTMFCEFQVPSKVIQLYIYMHWFFYRFFSQMLLQSIEYSPLCLTGDFKLCMWHSAGAHTVFPMGNTAAELTKFISPSLFTTTIEKEWPCPSCRIGCWASKKVSMLSEEALLIIVGARLPLVPFPPHSRASHGHLGQHFAGLFCSISSYPHKGGTRAFISGNISGIQEMSLS